MAEGDKINPNNHTARWVPRSKIDGNIVSGLAFKLREKEKYLSVFCLEMHQGDSMQEQIEDLKSYVHLSNKAPKFCVHNVGVLISTVRDEASSEISVIHHPEDDRPSHCGIWGTEKAR